MATFGPVRYGKTPLYGQNDYSVNPANLIDSVTSTDAGTVTLTSVQADSLTPASAYGATISTSLADTLATPTDAYAALITSVQSDTLATPTDSFLTSLNVALADSISSLSALANAMSTGLTDTVAPFDTALNFTYIAALTDFFICKEFISPIVKRATTWTMTTVSRTVTPHMYGNVLYSKNMYSTNIAILWASIKKDADSWKVGSASRTTKPHIYGSVTYADNMYSTNIALLWAHINKSKTPGFTNDNGHKYNHG